MTVMFMLLMRVIVCMGMIAGIAVIVHILLSNLRHFKWLRWLIHPRPGWSQLNSVLQCPEVASSTFLIDNKFFFDPAGFLP